MMKLKHNLCWSRSWWIIHEKLLHLWDYGLVCSFHCLNYLIPTFITLSKSDLHANIHLWMVSGISDTRATLFSVKKIQTHKNNTERVQKNEAMSILHTKVDPSEKDVECRLQLYKQEMCDFLYKASAMVFHREYASSFPAYNARHLL